MFFKSWVQMGGFELNHHWHGIDMLIVFECALLAAVLCALLTLISLRSKRKWRTILALAGTVSFATAAWAANTALSNLSAASVVNSTDIFYDVQTAGTGGVKATAAQIKTFANNTAVDARTTTSEAIANSDQNKLITFSNASAVACTIAQAGTGGNFAAGWATTLKNIGVGTTTCTATTSLFFDSSNTGSSTITLTTGQGLDLYTDGVNYFVQSGKGGGATPGGSSGQLQTNNGSGGFGAVAAPTGTVVGTSDTQTLTNKSIAASEVNSGTLAASQLPIGINHPGYQPNIYYALPPTISIATGGAPSATTAYCSIGLIGGNSKVTISQLAARITTLGTSNIQLAIYNNDFTSGIARPGTLVANTANIVDTSTGSVAGSFTGVQINPNWYWICLQANDTTVRYQVPAAASFEDVQFVGSATLAGLLTPSVTTGVSTTTGVTSFGTWPSFVGATFSEGTSLGPHPAVLFSSVP